MRFGITLAVRSVPGSPPSKFSFRHNPELDPYWVNVARDDILQTRGGHFPFFNNLRAAEYRVHLNNLR
jgi:hypothetical protein